MIRVQNFHLDNFHFYFFFIFKCHFGADMSSSVHIDNKNKDILILGEGPTQGLDDSTLTTEAKCSINFTASNKISKV